MANEYKSNAPRIASIQNPIIAAAVGALFRLESEAHASEKLAWIGKHFIRAKEQDAAQEGQPPSLRLWVRGFAVTPDEQRQGYRGHYARLTIAPVDSGRFTIKAEKLPVALARHPQKERPKVRHPNWGHPTMRAVETGKPYPSITVARVELIQLHEAFPDATIPGRDRVHVMVYNRKASAVAGSPPIEKLTVKIKPLADGSAKLVIARPPKRKKPEHAAEPQGKFTAMVKQGRIRKLPRTDGAVQT